MGTGGGAGEVSLGVGVALSWVVVVSGSDVVALLPVASDEREEEGEEGEAWSLGELGGW